MNMNFSQSLPNDLSQIPGPCFLSYRQGKVVSNQKQRTSYGNMLQNRILTHFLFSPAVKALSLVLPFSAPVVIAIDTPVVPEKCQTG